jgi:N-sulfoglucosamine sulfohydrolase
MGRIDATRDHVFTGRERHGYNRTGNLGYPMRSIVTDDYLYIHNFEPENGAGDMDGSPTRDLIWNGVEDPELKPYWELTWGMRPHDELYTAVEGPDCIVNVAGDPEYEKQVASLKTRLFDALRAQGDPRMVGRGWVFDCFPYYGKPRVEEDKDASPECNYYQKRRVPDDQQAPNMNATGKWAKWV